MQDAILNTKNLTVMAKPVNDLLLVEQQSSLTDDNNQVKLKVAGVVLGYSRFKYLI